MASHPKEDLLLYNSFKFKSAEAPLAVENPACCALAFLYIVASIVALWQAHSFMRASLAWTLIVVCQLVRG